MLHWSPNWICRVLDGVNVGTDVDSKSTEMKQAHEFLGMFDWSENKEQGDDLKLLTSLSL